MQKRPLLGLTLAELQNVVKNLGMPGFSAKQMASWLYDKKVTSIDEMSNLSLKHRELLKEIYEVGAEAPVDAMRSVDGTVKYLYRAGEGHFVEAVYIPDEDRATLCVSSQVGCKDELQILYDRQAGLYRQSDIQPDYQPNQFVARKGQADQCGNDGHGRTT